MARPRLTFACELDSPRLTALLRGGSVIEHLQALRARVALMLSDFSEARAAVVQQLNAAGIPVIAIPLMPYEDGYYFTIENAPRTRARYEEWRAWTARHMLAWEGVGLDIEPKARVFEQIMSSAWGLAPMLVRRLGQTERCVWQGFLPRLRSFDWRPATDSPEGVWLASSLRRTLRAALWASAHPWPVVGSSAAAACIVRRWRTARR